VKKQLLPSLLFLPLVLAATFTALAQIQPALSGSVDGSGSFTSFDAPGAGTGAMQGTVAIGINTAGTVIGTYLNSAGVAHGYLRTSGGTFTTITAPDAGTAKGFGTYALGIDTAGDVIGIYVDSGNSSHGFVRTANGVLTEFSGPNTNSVAPRDTLAAGINDSGTITGFYTDSENLTHGFVRTSAGVFTTLDAPGVCTSNGCGTYPSAINASGTVTGTFTAGNGPHEGFSYNGSFTVFTVPGASSGDGTFDGTVPTCIDTAGDTAGNYLDASGFGHSFVRTATGTITSFDAPGIGTGKGVLLGTVSVGINSAGTIVGGYTDVDGIYHAFVRTASGTISTFSAPDAGITGSIAGTGAMGVSSTGTIAGSYTDSNSILHGFIYTAGSLAATTTTLTASQTTSVYGEPATFTAKVASGSNLPADGEAVVFLSGTTTLGSAELTGGTASFTTTALPVGTDSVTAVYNGDLSFSASTSKAVSQTVGRATSTTSLKASLASSSFNQAVTFTATVAGQFGGVAAGTVSFYSGATKIGSATLAGNTATFATTALPVGTSSITAVYGGGSGFTGSTSKVVSVVVSDAATTTTLTNLSGSPLYPFSPLSLRAVVAGQYGGNPSGTVTFYSGSKVLGTASLSSGAAEIVLELPVASYSITAVYGGKYSYAGSTSKAVALLIEKAASSTEVMALTPNPSSFEESVTITATVASLAGGTPTGTLTFENGSTVLGTATLNKGTATFVTTAHPVGSNSIKAVYGGSADYLGSTSPAFTQTVNLGPTTTTLASSLNPSASGASVTFTATVKSVYGGSPAGTVEFYNGATLLGSATLSAGEATFATTKLPVGTDSITAVYTGKYSFSGSTSTAVSQIVN
jgi:hypothetical protein